MSDVQPDPYIDALAAEHRSEHEPPAPRCPEPYCDGDAGHDGPHYQWVPE